MCTYIWSSRVPDFVAELRRIVKVFSYYIYLWYDPRCYKVLTHCREGYLAVNISTPNSGQPARLD